MKKIDPQLEALKWFLDLLAIDIETLSERELRKLTVDAEYFFVRPGRPLFPLEAPKTKAKKPQGMTLPLPIVEATGRIHFWPEDFPWRSALKKVQQELKDFFETVVGRPDPDVTKLGNIRIRLIPHEGKWRIGPELDITQITDPDEMPKIVRTVFCYALEGVPTDAIKRCAECNKFFYHISKREKLYCSPSCASRGSAKRRRQADPEAYRRKQREIMRRKYAQKRAEKLGVPVENIKIQKRVKEE